MLHTFFHGFNGHYRIHNTRYGERLRPIGKQLKHEFNEKKNDADDDGDGDGDGNVLMKKKETINLQYNIQ